MAKRFIFLSTVLLFLGVAVGLHAQEEASAASLYNSGMTKAKAKEFAESLSLLEQAIEKADPEADAKVIKAAKANGTRVAYYAGRQHHKEENFEKAVAAYDKGIEFNPQFYANYKGKAISLEDKGDVAKAVKTYIEAGDIAEQGGKSDKAKEVYNKAENIVAVTWGNKDWEATAEYASAFLELRETPDVHYYLAAALKETNKAEKAVEHADKAIELAGEGNTNKYYFVKAESLESLGQTQEAIEAYKKVSGSKYGERAKYKVNELSNGGK